MLQEGQILCVMVSQVSRPARSAPSLCWREQTQAEGEHKKREGMVEGKDPICPGGRMDCLATP